MSDRYPTTWERFLLWISRGKQRPVHDCRVWLPSPLDLADGTYRTCPKCGMTREKQSYWDDDPWGGTAEYHTWGRVA